MGNHNKQLKTSEQDLLKIASFVCNYAPGEILLIGGGCVLQETARYKRMRNISDDLDFILSDEGLVAIEQPLSLRDTYSDGEKAGARVAYINDILLGFFHKELRGWSIPHEVFEHPRVEQTSQGKIYMISPELNVALKIRRGASKIEQPHIYGKDVLDFASIHSGMYECRQNFNSELFASYMARTTCKDCRLSTNRACIMCFKKSESQLHGAVREAYAQTLEQCTSLLAHCCQK